MKIAKVTEYPLEMNAAKNVGVNPNDIHQISNKTKIEEMDSILRFYGETISGLEIRNIVQEIFGINLNDISEQGEGSLLSTYPKLIMEIVRHEMQVDSTSTELDTKIMSMKKADIMDMCFAFYGDKITGNDIRRVINDIFGINLNGISSLENARISIYSKGQWIIQKESDLFVVSTRTGDVDVMVYPTAYFTDRTGLKQLPIELQEALTKLGYYYNEKVKAFYYVNPTGETISDSFKGQTMNAIIYLIQHLYSDIPK